MNIENNFKYHAPKEGQPEKYEAIRAKAKELAILIKELCPQSRELSVAMTQLETAVMWANAAIARNSDFNENLFKSLVDIVKEPWSQNNSNAVKNVIIENLDEIKAIALEMDDDLKDGSADEEYIYMTEAIEEFLKRKNITLKENNFPVRKVIIIKDNVTGKPIARQIFVDDVLIKEKIINND